MALGFIQVNSKQERYFDIISLMVEAGSCICSKHDQIAADNVHLHASTNQEHCKDSIVLAKGIFQRMHVESIDTSTADMSRIVVNKASAELLDLADRMIICDGDGLFRLTLVLVGGDDAYV
jgi:hypothetical protein